MVRFEEMRLLTSVFQKNARDDDNQKKMNG